MWTLFFPIYLFSAFLSLFWFLSWGLLTTYQLLQMHLPPLATTICLAILRDCEALWTPPSQQTVLDYKSSGRGRPRNYEWYLELCIFSLWDIFHWHSPPNSSLFLQISKVHTSGTPLIHIVLGLASCLHCGLCWVATSVHKIFLSTCVTVEPVPTSCLSLRHLILYRLYPVCDLLTYGQDRSGTYPVGTVFWFFSFTGLLICCKIPLRCWVKA